MPISCTNLHTSESAALPTMISLFTRFRVAAKRLGLITHQRNVQAREAAGQHAAAEAGAQPLQLAHVRLALQRRRAVRPGGRAAQPEHRQYGGQHEVGERQLRLGAVQVVHVRVHRHDEHAVQHRQHAGGDEELGVGADVRRHRDARRRRVAHAGGVIEAERIVEVDHLLVGRGVRAGERHVHGEVAGGGERADGEDLVVGGGGKGMIYVF